MAGDAFERVANGRQVVGSVPAVEQRQVAQQLPGELFPGIESQALEALPQGGFDTFGQFRPALRIWDAICCAMSRTASVCSTSLVKVTIRHTGVSVSRS